MPDVWFPNINLKIEHLPRVAFNIFGLDVYMYGITMCLAIFAGLLLVLKIAEKTKQDKNLYLDFVFYAMIFSIIGARLYYVVFSWESYKHNLLKVFAIREGGIAIYGAVIAAFITAIIFCKKRKINLWQFTDTCSFGLVLGQAIGRWGNFFNREAYGRFTDSILAMRYLSSQVNFIPESIKNNAIININGFEYIQVHPTFLYESLWNLGVLCILFAYSKHRKFDGELLLIYLGFYGIGRFWIEGLRIDQLLIWNCNVPISQLISLFLIIVSFSVIIINRIKLKKFSS